MENSSFCRLLTPGHVGAAKAPPSPTPPPVPTSSKGHQPSEDTVLNIELAKSRLGELLRTLERKDIIVKAKRSRPSSKAPSSIPQRGGSAPAAATAATPSPPLTTCRAIIMVRCQRTLILAGMFPPPSPLPWAAAQDEGQPAPSVSHHQAGCCLHTRSPALM